LAIFLAALLLPAPPRAQLMLPGALQVQPPPGGNGITDPGGHISRRPKLAGLKPPSETTIVGRELSRDGFAGIMAFQSTSRTGLEITKLSLAGEAMSYPPEPCLVDVVTETPIQARYSGRPNGTARYDVEVSACPFSLEVLDGAVLVTRTPGPCEFEAARCRVDPAGLWGPPGSTIGPDQAKQFESDRSRAESDMRTNFRALLTTAGKDAEAVKKIAGEQAGFSSVREMTCRTYLHEEVHGVCALRLTQARALALSAAFEERTKKQTDMKPVTAEEERTIAKRNPMANSKMDAPVRPKPEPGPPSQPEATPR
ncbi:MAG: hypothetical protein L0Y60_12700, partial [Beijerinckiaceae bacterium]|nr:hypothetical protein [Beijerinckiaceae bacterium]